MSTTRRALPLFAAAALWAAAPSRARHESPQAPPARTTAAIILDPGHGGSDLGAVLHGGVEKDLALLFARKVKERLERLAGLPVLLTRDDDTYVALDKRVEESLEQDAAVFVSLHLNQERRKKKRGILVFAYGRQLFKTSTPRISGLAPLPPPPQELARESSALASSVARSLRLQGFKVDEPHRASFYVLRNPRIPSLLIELGYLSHPEEGLLLQQAAYQDRLADAVAASLAAPFLAGQHRLAIATGGR